MAAIKFGETCPAYNWISGDKFNCNYCPHLNGYFWDDENNEIIDCKYSKIPYFESPFKVGDMVWYLNDGQFPTYGKVRKIIWRGSYYNYCCDRKQHSYQAYSTKEECYNALAIDECERGISIIKDAIKHAGGLESFKQLINTNNVKLLDNIKQVI